MERFFYTQLLEDRNFISCKNLLVIFSLVLFFNLFEIAFSTMVLYKARILIKNDGFFCLFLKTFAFLIIIKYW